MHHEAFSRDPFTEVSITLSAAQELLGMSASSVLYLRTAGFLPAYRWNGQLRFGSDRVIQIARVKANVSRGRGHVGLSELAASLARAGIEPVTTRPAFAILRKTPTRNVS